MRVILTGGGTGGHIYPALAVAESLKKLVPDARIHYVGGSSGPEVEIVPAAGIPFKAVSAKKLRRWASLSTIGVLFSLMRGYGQAWSFLRAFKPDVVIGTGGYVAGATALAAARQGIPLIIQACDAVPGRTNLMIAKSASQICVWFEETKQFFPADRTVATGVPLRRSVICELTRAGARNLLGLPESGLVVFAVGGSQGAKRLNEIVLDAAAGLKDSVSIVHQTGARNHDEVAARAKELGLNPNYRPLPYLGADEIAAAYRAADVVVCRCGIGSLAEVTANGAPSILVPLPTAYADHQTANARQIEGAGAGILAPEGMLTGQSLAAMLRELAGDAGRLDSMSVAARGISRPDAADVVAGLAIETGTTA